MTKIKAGIVVATGYTGIELVRLLGRHPNVEVSYLTSESQDGKGIGEVFPHLQGLAEQQMEPFDPVSAAEKCNLIFLARGNGFGMEHTQPLLDFGLKVIDLAADFRLKDPEIWKDYYGTDHSATELLAESVYGLPELHSEAIKGARLVGNPGCYTTCSILGLAPAVSGQWIEPGGVIVNAVSGVSGAGRSRKEAMYLFSELEANFKAYSVAKHRHTPEIEQELSLLAGQDIILTFTPHLAPMTRGILATIYATLSDGADIEALLDAYEDFYKDAPFVQIAPPGSPPETKQVRGSNYCRIGLEVNRRSGQLVIMSVVDNLVKGASGQAIQNMNLMLGFPETTGLEAPALYP